MYLGGTVLEKKLVVFRRIGNQMERGEVIKRRVSIMRNYTKSWKLQVNLFPHFTKFHLLCYYVHPFLRECLRTHLDKTTPSLISLAFLCLFSLLLMPTRKQQKKNIAFISISLILDMIDHHSYTHNLSSCEIKA